LREKFQNDIKNIDGSISTLTLVTSEDLWGVIQMIGKFENTLSYRI
jgi:hypothetical protein